MGKRQKSKIVQKWLSLTRLEKIFLVLVICLTVIRILLALKIPLHIQAGAVYDDRLLVNYSSSMLSGKWLGAFNQLTLAKGASYSVFLAVNYLLGLPYSFTLIMLYIIAVVVFCIAISKLVKRKVFLCVLYSLLLYSPVMFHDENVQKIYRGGVIVIFALLIVAAMIGLYTRIEEKNRKILCWALLATIVLVFFWFLKEDSIWIMPFVLGGVVFSMIRIFKAGLPREQKIRKVVLVVMPLVGLFVGVNCYKIINYAMYGEFAVTDRQDTYFSEVASDLIKIEGEGRSKDNWVTRDMLSKAYAVSPTLTLAKEKIDDSYNGWAKEDGEIEGDIIFWVIKDAVAEAGFYESGESANDFYRKVDEELKTGFNDGKLEKNNDFYISSIAKGINGEEISEFVRHLGESLDNVVSYKYNETGIYEASGDRAGIALFNGLTMSQYVEPGVDIGIYRVEQKAVDVVSSITKVYQFMGIPFFCLMILSFVVLLVYVIGCMIKKKMDWDELRLCLIMVGILLTCFVLFFGTAFFCRFLSQRKVYDYASPMLPMMLATELISLYAVFAMIINPLIRKYWRTGRKRQKVL